MCDTEHKWVGAEYMYYMQATIILRHQSIATFNNNYWIYTIYGITTHEIFNANGIEEYWWEEKGIKWDMLMRQCNNIKIKL